MITVCLPVYNMEKTIERTLNSCLIQELDDNIEFLLIDNASTDSTYKIANSFIGRISNFRIIRNKKNIGAYGNHNFCIENAKNEWIKFLHGDDILLPGALKFIKKFIDKDDINFVFFDYVGNQYNKQLNLNSLILEKKHAKLLVLYGNFIGTPSTTIFKKNAFVKIGMFDLDLDPAADADAFFRLTLNYGALFLNQKLVKIDDDPFSNYESFEKNRLMFLNNAFLQLDKWRKIYSNILNEINWKEVYKNESFRFFDASIILITKFRFKMIIELFFILKNKKVFIYSLFYYFINKISFKNSNQIRKTKWYNDIYNI